MRYLTILIFVLFTSYIDASSVIEVCVTCEFNTIKSALDSAADCDTILIHPGVYHENNIMIEKSITLIGIDYPVIDANNEGYVFIVGADQFEINGLKLINVGQSYTKDYAAILAHRCKDFVITNNILENVYFGILVEKSKHGEISNNQISSIGNDEASSGNGVHFWHCSNMVVSNNDLWNLRDGIYFEFVSKSEIYGNLSRNNIRYGLHFMFSNENIYHHNHFENNGSGVAVMFSKFVKMLDNVFIQNWGAASYGLLLKEINDAEIVGNTFEENTSGIHVEGCSRVVYEKNNFVSNGWAINMAGACYENFFNQNNFLYNSFDISMSGRLNDNSFDNNFWSEYNGYDLDHDGFGDVPFRPVKLFSYIVNKAPESIVLLRSLFVDIINFSEKVSPVFTPVDLIDNFPLMKPVE